VGLLARQGKSTDICECETIPPSGSKQIFYAQFRLRAFKSSTGVGDYAACLACSEPIDLDGTVIRVLTLDALIDAKRAMGRPRDLRAVLELEAIRERLRRGN
jgi:hypothetical protein